jgi:hypothetical protein
VAQLVDAMNADIAADIGADVETPQPQLTCRLTVRENPTGALGSPCL